MNKTIPTITLENGENYEIKRNRHILLEIEKIREGNKLSAEDNKNYAILQEKYSRLQKLANRVQELEDAYYENFDDDARDIYEKANAQYNKMLNETLDFELTTDGIAQRVQKATLDKMELLIINALTIDENGETIRAHQQANDIWCTFVDERGKETASEWLLYAFNYLSGNDGDNEDDPFIAARKAKEERKANMKRGIERVR